jgi:nitrile hydratase accessory protein
LSPSESAALGPLARRDDESVFDEPWQAQVLALAFNLVEKGVFTARQWSDALGAELKRAGAGGEPDVPETYYQSALTALESLLVAEGRIAPDNLNTRIEAWRRAYLNTPHGRPVELPAARGMNRRS